MMKPFLIAVLFVAVTHSVHPPTTTTTTSSPTEAPGCCKADSSDAYDQDLCPSLETAFLCGKKPGQCTWMVGDDPALCQFAQTTSGCCYGNPDAQYSKKWVESCVTFDTEFECETLTNDLGDARCVWEAVEEGYDCSLLSPPTQELPTTASPTTASPTKSPTKNPIQDSSDDGYDETSTTEASVDSDDDNGTYDGDDNDDDDNDNVRVNDEEGVSEHGMDTEGADEDAWKPWMTVAAVTASVVVVAIFAGLMWFLRVAISQKATAEKAGNVMSEEARDNSVEMAQATTLKA